MPDEDASPPTNFLSSATTRAWGRAGQCPGYRMVCVYAMGVIVLLSGGLSIIGFARSSRRSNK